MIICGADPEVFLVDEFGNFQSAIGLIGGTKEEPLPIGVGAVQEDNVSVEFNIPPATSAEEFDNYISEMLQHVEDIADEYYYKPSIVSVANFNTYALDSPEAKQIGCDPDYNIYSLQRNLYDIDSYVNGNLRFGAGHIHLGHDMIAQEEEAMIKAVKLCDLIIGVPLLHLEMNDMDTDLPLERLKFYGQSGCFRKKPYGVEYRTPSNYWIRDKHTREFVFNQVQRVELLLNSGIDYYSDYYSDVVHSAIDNHDPLAQQDIIAEFGITLPKEV